MTQADFDDALSTSDPMLMGDGMDEDEETEDEGEGDIDPDLEEDI
jgi:hypothetical protein